MTSRWLAVDSGQTGLRLRTGDRHGRGPGFDYRGGDPVTTIVRAVRSAATQADVSGPFDVACLGLTGCPPLPEDRARLGAAVADLLEIGEVRLCEDMVTAHAGALPGGTGVVVAAGTGVVCLAVGPDGTHRKIDGSGYLLGDAGSGFSIGQAGLRAVVAASDGRGPATALTARATRRYGSGPALIQAVYLAEFPVAVVAGFTPDVFAAAAEGDAVAADIVAAAAEQLAASAAAGVQALAAGPATVACTGRLFDAGEALLGPLRTRLAEFAPAARLVPAAGDPLTGAIRLATGALGPYAPLVHRHHREPT